MVSRRGIVLPLLLQLLLLGFLLTDAAHGQVTIVVGGNYTGVTTQALNDIGRTYTLASGVATPDPTTYGLKAGDIIITANDGGTGSLIDYTNFLNAGGHVIVIGGSNVQTYRDWAALYFNLTDTGSGWHTDGGWTNLAIGNAVTAGLPTTYTFGNNNATYHMLSFLATPNTLLYGQNSEPNFIGAFRTYNNGGTLNYLALDIGVPNYITTGDYSSFALPWMRDALATAIPEPSTFALFGTGLAVLGVRAWRRRTNR